MRKVLALLLALLAGITPVAAQQFSTVPNRSVIGRIGSPTDPNNSGASQAIPFGTLVPQLGIPDVYASAFGVKCDGVTDDTVAAQNAINAAAGKVVVFPAGLCLISSTLNYHTNVAGLTQGLQIRGQGREETNFRTSVANGCLFLAQADVNFQFQSGVTFSDFKISSDGVLANTCGIEVYRSAYVKFSNIQMSSLTGNGIFIPASAGDADSSFEVSMDRIRMDNVGSGGAWCIQMNAPTGGYSSSNVRLENSTLSTCGVASSAVPPTSGAFEYKGLILQLKNVGFTTNFNVDLYLQGPDTSTQVSIEGVDFENVLSTVLPHVYVEGGIRGFNMLNSECLNNDTYTSLGCVWFNGTPGILGNVTLDKVEVRATAASNAYTAFKATGANTMFDTLRVGNIYWQTFDFSGQTRFSGFQFTGIPGLAQFSINGTNSAILSGIGYGFSMPMHLAANGEWVEYQVPTAGITKTGIGGLSNNTAYYFYLYNSAAVNAPYVGTLEVSSSAPTSDAVGGYQVKTGDSTRTYIGTATTDGSGNFQTTSTQSSQYPTGGGFTFNSGTAGFLARYVSSTNLAATATGSGVLTALGSNVGTNGAFVVRGGDAGTPSALGLANATGLPYTALPSLSANQLLGALTATTPSGQSVPSCSTSASALQWTTGTGFGCNTAIAAPVSGLTGAGTGVLTALGINIGSAGAIIVRGGDAGTPSALGLVNSTGLPLSTGVTGTLQAAQEPAHTGDCTNSAGSLALTCTKTNGTSFGNYATLSAGQLANSLGADVLLNNTASFFDGPSIAQGTTGTWFASGTVTVSGAAADQYFCKLWDATTVIASTETITNNTAPISLSLSGFLTTPAANIRISCRDVSSTTGKILFNSTGISKDSTLTAFRIN